MKDLSIQAEAILDLFPPAILEQALRYQRQVSIDNGETGSDWEPRHIQAAKDILQHCSYTYGSKSSAFKEALRLVEYLEP